MQETKFGKAIRPSRACSYQLPREKMLPYLTQAMLNASDQDRKNYIYTTTIKSFHNPKLRSADHT